MNKKNYLLGLYILFLPVFLFLDISNLRQISNKSLVFILISILFIFFIILILIKIYSFIFKSKKISSNIFPGLCFAFYIQFYYSEIKEIFENNVPNIGYIVFIFLLLLSALIIFLWSKYFEFLNKFSIIFSTLITLIFVYNFYIFSSISSRNVEANNLKTENNFNNINKNKSFNNIYFIIFDAMSPLKDFKENINTNNNFNINQLIEQFNPNFRYIKNSVTNYNKTNLSISSIFHNGYFIDEKSKKFKDYDDFYPYFFYNQNKANKLNLLNILKKNEINFIWFSNSSMPCKNLLSIICGSGSNFETDILNDIKTFYTKTFLIVALDRLTRSLVNDIPSDNLLNYIKNTKSKNNFFFIHNFIPNGKTSFNSNCDIIEEITNYSDRYLCSIKKITELTNMISKHDPHASVIITADHGASSNLFNKENRLMDDMEDVSPYYDARIFTLIKFPKNCSHMIPKTYDTLNLVRYLLNCNYSQKLNYLPYSHFRTYPEHSKNFGSLINNTKEVMEYLNKVN